MKTKASGPDQKRKPGNEGLPYSDAAQVCGGPVDDQPEPGLKPEKGVKGSGSIKPPKNK